MVVGPMLNGRPLGPPLRPHRVAQDPAEALPRWRVAAHIRPSRISRPGGVLHRALESQTCVAKGLAISFCAESPRDNHFSLNARAIWSCMGLIK